MNKLNIDIKKKDEEKISPGAIFEDAGEPYILATPSAERFCCVSLIDGNRWNEPAGSIKKATEGLTLMAKSASITISENEN